MPKMIEIDGRKFHSLHLRHGRYGGVDVIGYGTYPRSSVLAGQTSVTFIDNFPTEAEARAKYPKCAADFTSRFTQPRASVSHLPGEDDPVPGGMYPDDVGA